MLEGKNISNIALPEPTLRRLPWYLAYINLLNAKNIEYVSSTQISKDINVDASQIAKDLSFLNMPSCYNSDMTKSLAKELEDFLGFKRVHNTFMMGVGSLGAALIQDSGLSQYGLRIVAGFDVNPLRIGTSICGVPIFHVSELKMRQQELNAEIGVLAVPVENAQEATDVMINGGIKAIWNFTPFRIKAPENIVIQNTSIYAHLAVMYNRMNTLK